MPDQLHDRLSILLSAAGLELFDLEVTATRVVVTVDRPGGVDLDALTEANRLVSAELDELDPVSGRYVLEVTSPGLERRLRTPEHFRRAVGEAVTVRTAAAPVRRLRGRLVAADEHGITLEGDDLEGGRAVVAYADIGQARTEFTWGSTGPPRPGSRRRSPRTTAEPATPTERATTP